MRTIVGRWLVFGAGVRCALEVRYPSFFAPQKITSLVTKRHRVRQCLLVIALFFIWLALIVPVDSSLWDTTAQGHDVMVVLDVSQSMQVQDVEYGQSTIDRLTAAKTALAELVAKQRHNRRWLVVFAGEAIGITPLTYDAELFLTFLAGVDHQNVTTQGTNLVEALTVAAARFDTGDTVWRIIVLVSDGGDEEIVITDETKQLLETMQIHLIVRGVGSDQGGYIPEWTDPFGNVIYKQYQGQQVISTYSETALRSIANATHWLLVRLKAVDRIDEVVRRFETIEKRRFTIDAWVRQVPLARRPLVGCVFCILLYCLTLLPRRSRYGEPYVNDLFYRVKGLSWK